MYSFVLQDWITIQGSGTSTTILQSEDGWLDMSPYQDVCAWVDVREQANNPTLWFETSPSADAELFVKMHTTAVSLTVPATPTPQVIQLLMGSAAVPIARYLRWRIDGTTPWEVTMRILIAANAPGLQLDAPAAPGFLLRPDL